MASELSGMEWSDVANDPDFYNDVLYQAAATVLPDHFNGADAVERAVTSAVQSGITPDMLIDRLRRWCIARDSAGRRHKVLLQLDELGQWIASGNANERIMQVQALVETAAQAGRWPYLDGGHGTRRCAGAATKCAAGTVCQDQPALRPPMQTQQ